MSKIILIVYIIFNGTCYQDRVVYWATAKEFHLVGSQLNYHAVRSKIQLKDSAYTYYTSGDTLYAVKVDYQYGYLMIVNRFKLNDRGAVKSIDATLLSTNRCK